MTKDEAFYENALARIRRFMAVLSLAGTLGFWLWRGWAWGAGFAIGAVLAWLNFRWMKRIVDSLGGENPRPPASGAVILGLRFVILGAIAYVILKYSAISVYAVLAGLFVTVAAAILEVIFELVYARS